VKIGTTITTRPALAAGVLISLPRAASVETVRVCSRFFPAGWGVPAHYWCHLLQRFCFSHSCAGAVASHNGKRSSSACGNKRSSQAAGRERHGSYSSTPEHVQELVDPVFAVDGGRVLRRQHEIAFLQNPNGADVVLGHESVQWPLFEFGNESGEGSRRNSPVPELASNPIADQPPVLCDPASDVPGHLSVANDCADDVRGLAPELGPMFHERVTVPRGKRRHPHGFRVALMLKENRKIGFDDLA